MKKAIAMRCTKKQYKSVKPKLKSFTKSIKHGFKMFPYLTNRFNYSENFIGNIDLGMAKTDPEKEIYETWNEKVFLSACGIETEHIPTLEEVKEYFKDADMVEDALGNVGHVSNINKIETHLWGDDCRICNEGFSGNIYLWSREEGYSKILTYKEKKEPEIVITKSQAIKLHPYLDYEGQQMFLKWFPNFYKEDKVELPKDFTGWVKTDKISDPDWLMYYEKGILQYGFDSNKEWFLPAYGCKINHGIKQKREATPEEVKEALTKEAVKRGYEKDHSYSVIFKLVCNIEFNNYSEKYYYAEHSNILYYKGIAIFYKGQWAEITQTITKEDAEKELGKKILN